MAVEGQIETKTLCQVNNATVAGPRVILICLERSGVAGRAACRYECTTIIMNSWSKLSCGFFFQGTRVKIRPSTVRCNLFLLL